MRRARRRWLAVFVCGFVTIASGQRVPADTTLPATNPAASAPATQPVRLQPGREPGTYRLVYRNCITFTMDRSFPSTVSVRPPIGDPLFEMQVRDDRPFVLETDLYPGSYTVWSELTSPQAQDTHDTLTYDSIHIDKHGHLTRPMHSGPLCHVRRISDPFPAQGEIAEAAEPVVSWTAVPGAERYQVVVRGMRYQSLQTQKTAIKVRPEQLPGQRCVWQVFAFGKDDRLLASAHGGFWAFGTTPAEVERANAEAVCRPRQLPQGPGYLGLKPFGLQTPKDPQQLHIHDTGTTARARGWGAATVLVPTIEITDIMPRSPASEAGLLPDDAILAIDGKPVPAEDGRGDAAAFAKLIGGTAPRATLKLTVRRGKTDMELPVVVGRVPTATDLRPATRPAFPTTRP